MRHGPNCWQGSYCNQYGEVKRIMGVCTPPAWLATMFNVSCGRLLKTTEVAASLLAAASRHVRLRHLRFGVAIASSIVVKHEAKKFTPLKRAYAVRFGYGVWHVWRPISRVRGLQSETKRRDDGGGCGDCPANAERETVPTSDFTSSSYTPVSQCNHIDTRSSSSWRL